MHWLQHHWYRITPLHLILFPVSLLFRALAALRRTLYRGGILPSEKLTVPVIVVGNISVGGTGKTPLTLALAQQLLDQGWHPLIVSRGFTKGTQSTAKQASRGIDSGGTTEQQAVSATSTAQQVGDEPLLMARRNLCPVWVGVDRAATARAALQANPQCDVVLCDDGLQHYRLQRDVEIAVVDGVRGFGNGWLLPAGPLREPVSRLRTVDAVVVNGGNTAPIDPAQIAIGSVRAERSWRSQRSRSISAAIPFDSAALRSGRTVETSLRRFNNQYTMQLSGAVFYNLLDPEKTATAADLQGLRIHAVAGIGHPHRYFRHLEALGISFTPHAFPDHHPYVAADLAFSDCDALLLTEKDAVKCAAFADARYWVLRVDAQIDPALLAHILRKIEPHGRQTA